MLYIVGEQTLYGVSEKYTTIQNGKTYYKGMQINTDGTEFNFLGERAIATEDITEVPEIRFKLNKESD